MSNSTRSTNSYDERYVVPLEASRRGAHRARVSPLMAALPVVAVVGIVVGAIALVYVFFGKLGGGNDTASQPVASPAATASANPSGAASPSTSGPALTTSPAAAGTVDKTITVSVYNGTRTSGLARRAGDKLTVAGWTLGPVQTWTGPTVSATTVYYGSQAQHASALAIVKALGHGVARLSAATAGAGIAVVIGPDYPGAVGGAVRTHSSTSGLSGPKTSPTHVPTPTATAPAGTASPAN